MRHTKIIATIGPASDSDATLDALMGAGTDIFRLNFSHGTHATQRATCTRIREAVRSGLTAEAAVQTISSWGFRNGRKQNDSWRSCGNDCGSSAWSYIRKRPG